MELFKSVKKGCQKSRRKTEEFFRILFGRDLSGEEERLASKKWRKTLLLASLSAGVSYLFSLATLPFGITSLGYAFFASAVGSEAIFSLVGILLSLFSHSAPFVTLFVISLGILMRVLIKKTAVSAKYFEESRRVRCALATALAFLSSFAEAALIGFPKALAKEEGHSGITVNAIAPSVIATEMNARLSEEDRDKRNPEDDSRRIINQKELLQSYVAAQGWEIENESEGVKTE